MTLLLQITLGCMLGGLLSVLAAALMLFGLSKKWLPYAVSFSTGVLLSTAMLHLLPQALTSGLTPDEAFPVLLAGVLGFFALEKFALWRHAHHHVQSTTEGDIPAHNHDRAAVLSILVGDGFHNFTDGLLIAAAFLTEPALGWATTFAVIAHEIPQEAGDFAILLSAGWGRRRALLWNGLSSLASVAGGVTGFFALEHMQEWIPYIVIIAAASFLYIAIADLLPRLRLEWKGIGWHGLLLAAGIAISAL